jgi:hypothetical protein
VKRIKNLTVTTLTGEKFRLPHRGPNGVLEKDKDGNLKTIDTDSLLDVLKEFVLYGQPRDKFTALDVLRITQVYRALAKAKAEIALETDDFAWLKTKLEDDAVGVAMFGFNQPVILEAIENKKTEEDANS